MIGIIRPRILLPKDLGTFLKHLMNEAIRISTVCTQQELGSIQPGGDCIRGSSDYVCLIGGSSMLAPVWSKMLGHLWVFWVTKPSSPAKAELLAGVHFKGHLQIFCCLGSCWGDCP